MEHYKQLVFTVEVHSPIYLPELC